MRYKRGGFLFNPRDKFSWALSHALQPTPIKTKEGILVFCGFRDKDGVSRIGRILLSGKKKLSVEHVHPDPVLDVGEDGCFDDNGVVPCFVKRSENNLIMFYAGYQLVKKIKFQVFGGIAISSDEGKTFHRLSKTPFTDRTNDEPFFRVVHSIISKGDKFHFFYGGGDSFINILGKDYPSYNIRSFKSESLMKSDKKYSIIIDCKKNIEYRVARPYVYGLDSGFKMVFFSTNMENKFSLEIASSSDLKSWSREKLLIDGENEHWDNEMMAYPSRIATKKCEYIFYNGNNYGEDGFGYLYREL